MRIHSWIYCMFALSLAPDVLAQADPKCSNASWQGSYGLVSTGIIAGADYAALARVVADGAGNLSGTSLTTSINGAIQKVTFSGTYTVNPDCTGSVISDVEGPQPAQLRDIVVVDNGNEILAISTEYGQIVTINLKKMFSQQAAPPTGRNDDDDD